MVDLIHLCSSNYDLHFTSEELRKLAATEPVERATPNKPRSWTRLNAAAKADVVAAYEAGETSTLLAKKFNVSKTTILTVLRASNTKLRNQPITDADIAAARQLYEAGHSLSKLAEQMPFSQEAIRKALIAAGVRIRPAHR